MYNLLRWERKSLEMGLYAKATALAGQCSWKDAACATASRCLGLLAIKISTVREVKLWQSKASP